MELITNIINKLKAINGRDQPSDQAKETTIEVKKGSENNIPEKRDGNYFNDDKSQSFITGNQEVMLTEPVGRDDLPMLSEERVGINQKSAINKLVATEEDKNYSIYLERIKSKQIYYDLQKQIKELLSLYNWWSSVKRKDILICLAVYDYLKSEGIPKTSENIYGNLNLFLNLHNADDVSKLLSKYENFFALPFNHWTLSPIVPEEKFICHQKVYSVIKSRNTSALKYLINNYIHQKPYFEIDELKYALGLVAGIEIDEQILIEHIKNIGCHRCSYSNWTSNKDDNWYFTTNFKITWERTIQQWCQNLKDNEKHVLMERIINQKTLEETSKGLDVTRERVRQIEKIVFRKIQYTYSRQGYLKPYRNWIINGLQNHKMIDLAENGLDEREYGVFDHLFNDILNEKDIVRVFKGIVVFRPYYNNFLSVFDNLINKGNGQVYLGNLVEGTLLGNKALKLEPLLTEEMGMIPDKDCFNDNVYARKYIYSQVKNMEEAIYIVISRANRPLHVSELVNIAECYGVKWIFTTNTHNLLAAMQRHNKLKRVAPGTYGLKEWPIDTHVYIKDLIYSVLKEIGSPMTIDDIYEEVQERRNDVISKNSVYAYLNAHPDIACLNSNEYVLNQWLDKKGKLTNNKDLSEKKKSIRTKVLLDVFEYKSHYFCKYCISDSYIRMNQIRVSSAVPYKLNNYLVIIGLDGILHKCSYQFRCLQGLKFWGQGLKENDVFYMEFIDKKVARCLLDDPHKFYDPVPPNVIHQAYKLLNDNTKNQITVLDESVQHEVDPSNQDYSIDNLIAYGLENGYVTGIMFDKAVKMGNHPETIRIALDERAIRVKW